MPATRQQILACLMLMLLSVLGRPAFSQNAAVEEADLKAAFLYQFTKFVEWPSSAFQSAEDPLVIGVFGDEEFAEKLGLLLRNRKAHGRSFRVERLASIQEARSTHILCFRKAETRRLGQIYESIKRLPILTVGESAEFMDQGGMINFVTEETKQLRFEVNPAAAQTAGLAISSQLLRLAKTIRGGGAK